MPKLGMTPVRRAQVITAVIETIAAQGLEALTVDAVARQAGVSKGVVNYYFNGKNDLLRQSFQAFLESYNQQIVDRIRPEMGPMEMLEVVIDVCFPEGEVCLPLWQHDPGSDGQKPPLTESRPDESRSEESRSDGSQPGVAHEPCFSVSQLGKILVNFLTKTIMDPDFTRVFQTVYDAYLEGTKEIILLGIESGEFRQVDPEIAALGVLAQIEGMVQYRNLEFCPQTAHTYRALCKDFARRYLLKTPNQNGGNHD